MTGLTSAAVEAVDAKNHNSGPLQETS